jgi:hypothetical protein
MDFVEESNELIRCALSEYKKEFGEDAQLEEGESFVTEFNNCVLIISVEEGTLKTDFIGGKPYRVNKSFSIYESEGE